METVISVKVNSITTHGQQYLYLGEDEVNRVRGKRVLIVDDVISTGESLQALENLANEAGAKIVGKMAILGEGDAMERDDITVLAPLPVFDTEGNVK